MADAGPRWVVEGRGNGVKQLAENVDDDKVMFGIMRFTLGSGQFARDKYVFLHINGDKTPPMKRMKHNSKMDAAVEALGPTVHVTMQFGNRYEITSDAILESMLRLMRVDGESDYEKTVALMRKEVEKQLNAEPEPQRRPRRRTNAELAMQRLSIGTGAAPSFDLHKTLAELHSADGTLTFMLLEPDKTVIAAGPGSLPALVEELDDSKVLYALVRMNFGSGRFRRSKLVMMHFIGDTVGAVKRGRDNAKKEEMVELLSTGAACLTYTANGIDETDTPTVVTFVEKSIVTDEGMEGENSFSVEAFMKALEEDNAKAQAEAEAADGDEDASIADGVGGGGGMESFAELCTVTCKGNSRKNLSNRLALSRRRRHANKSYDSYMILYDNSGVTIGSGETR